MSVSVCERDSFFFPFLSFFFLFSVWFGLVWRGGGFFLVGDVLVII